MFLSCGELEPELSKLDQFLVGKISKLLGPLNACPPCSSFQGFYVVLLALGLKLSVQTVI